jgi:hypothetical protein
VKRPFPRLLLATVALVAAAALGSPRAGEKSMSAGNEYQGSEKCSACHQIQYKGWVKTFHSTVVQDARKNPSVILADMTDPDLPFKKEDIFFTIGGHWDQRYMTKIGDDYYILPRLWSIQSKKWRPYSTYGWQRRPYSRYCVGCHSVGFDPETKGVVEHAVGCESCHGPGRAHIVSPKRKNIVNPARIPKDRAEEICSSCHVRGKDPSGEYFFPIGWSPGEELADYRVPLEKQEGESNFEAIHRLWSKWIGDREAQARSRCQVCGIHQNRKPSGPKVSIDSTCMSCHEYDDHLPLHTHHPAGTPIGCGDCHEQREEAMNNQEEKNVHSYSYFLIHPRNCWDKEVYKKCGKCHSDKAEQWAYDTVSEWKKPFTVDH